MNNEYEINGEITTIYLKRMSGELVSTVVSTSDLPRIMEFPNMWYLHLDLNLKTYYVVGNSSPVNGKRITYRLHRWIFDNPKGMVIDHINHDTLCNTRQNLRVLTHAQNLQNRKGAQKNSTTKIRGVYWDKNSKKWRALIKINGKYIHAGLFEKIEDAEKAAIETRKRYMPFSVEKTS